MLKVLMTLMMMLLAIHSTTKADSTIESDISADYQDYLKPLFIHFHKNPELSLVEFKTAARMAKELRAAGFTVTEKVGATGVVALMDQCGQPAAEVVEGWG